MGEGSEIFERVFWGIFAGLAFVEWVYGEGDETSFNRSWIRYLQPYIRTVASLKHIGIRVWGTGSQVREFDVVGYEGVRDEGIVFDVDDYTRVRRYE